MSKVTDTVCRSRLTSKTCRAVVSFALRPLLLVTFDATRRTCAPMEHHRRSFRVTTRAETCHPGRHGWRKPCHFTAAPRRAGAPPRQLRDATRATLIFFCSWVPGTLRDNVLARATSKAHAASVAHNVQGNTSLKILSIGNVRMWVPLTDTIAESPPRRRSRLI